MTFYTRAHHWSLLTQYPVHTFLFSFPMLYCTVKIFLTRKIYFCQTLYLIWQLAVSAAVFMPWLSIMCGALFNSCQCSHWCPLQILSSHHGGHQYPLQIPHLMPRLSGVYTTDPVLVMAVTGICSVMFEYVFTPVPCSI